AVATADDAAAATRARPGAIVERVMLRAPVSRRPMGFAGRAALLRGHRRSMTAFAAAIARRGEGHPHPLRVAVFVFVGYYLGARLGLALTFRPHPISGLF